MLAGDGPAAALLKGYRRSVRLLIHSGGLPAHDSPDGVWSPEAIDEGDADWVAVRLVGCGQLRVRSRWRVRGVSEPAAAGTPTRGGKTVRAWSLTAQWTW